jgi:hypothetical protein
MTNPTCRTLLATLATAAAPPKLPAAHDVDYAAMAIEVVWSDFEAGWRYRADRELLAGIAATLEALGVQW